MISSGEPFCRTSVRRRFISVLCSLLALSFVFTCSNPLDKNISRPVLSIVSDTTVSVKDSIVLAAHAGAAGGRAIDYLWWLDGRLFSTSPAHDSSCTLVFGTRDTGLHVVVVKGLGLSNTMSDPETVFVTVLLHPPVVHFVTKDTTVFANDTVVVVARAADSNGSIIAFRWSIDTAATVITSASGTLTYCFGATSQTHVVRVTAMDNDSIVSAPDSVHVRVVATPPRIAAIRDTSVPINDTLIVRAPRIDTFSTLARWIWARNGTLFSDTTTGDSFAVRFGKSEWGPHLVLAKALNSHRLESNIDSAHIYVHLDAPVVSIVHDTTVYINDPVVFHARGTDTNGYIVKYLWALDGTHFADTTAGDSITHAWSRADTGRRIVVRVEAIDNDTLASNVDSALVSVHLKPVPSATMAVRDTSVYVNDSVALAAQGIPSATKSPITAFVWAVDNVNFADTTAVGRIVVRFGIADTGRHVVRVKAIDRDTMVSSMDSTVVHVRLGMPVIQAIRDTSVTWGDTVVVVVKASDINGAIRKYLWTTTGPGATSDSSASDTLKLTSSIHAPLKVIVGARDDDGLVARDTFTIWFGAVRCTVTVRGPKTRDTAWVHSTDSNVVTTPLSFSARRADGVADTFTYSLWSGRSPAALAEAYRGKDTACTLTTLDTGTWYWKIAAVDAHGDSTVTPTSSLSIMLQRRICFIGHSIVTGFDGTPGLGGFRRMVVDTLRAAAIIDKKVKCEGPLTTQNLLPVEDDSCLAVGGKTCAQIYDSLLDHPFTNADLWIYMCGVNEGYELPTWGFDGMYFRLENFSAVTLDSMHGRNPRSEIYVLNAVPFPADTIGDFNQGCDSIFKTNLPVFNRMLDSVVTLRRQQWGGGVWLVDVFDTLALLPDSVQNQIYFSDYLHPNQRGYDVMAGRIFKTMRSANSSFIK